VWCNTSPGCFLGLGALAGGPTSRPREPRAGSLVARHCGRRRRGAIILLLAGRAVANLVILLLLLIVALCASALGGRAARARRGALCCGRGLAAAAITSRGTGCRAASAGAAYTSASSAATRVGVGRLKNGRLHDWSWHSTRVRVLSLLTCRDLTWLRLVGLQGIREARKVCTSPQRARLAASQPVRVTCSAAWGSPDGCNRQAGSLQ